MSDRTCSIEGCAKRHKGHGLCSTHLRRLQTKGDPLVGPATPYGSGAAFIERAAASATDDCIVWPYGRNSNGYGTVLVSGQRAYAHRLVLERSIGASPSDGMQAAHTPGVCHNRACVNPRHLRWATPQQNCADKLIDGTHNRGDRHPMAKLTAAQVLAIRADQRLAALVAVDYGISPDHVRSIRQRRVWKAVS